MVFILWDSKTGNRNCSNSFLCKSGAGFVTKQELIWKLQCCTGRWEGNAWERKYICPYGTFWISVSLFILEAFSIGFWTVVALLWYFNLIMVLIINNFKLRDLEVWHGTWVFVPICCCTSYLLTYLLTPRSRVLVEKLTGSQLVKKFTIFYGTRGFITTFTCARHPSLSWASSIQSMPPHPTSWRSILILSSHLHLGLPSGLFPSIPTNTTYILIIFCKHSYVFRCIRIIFRES